MEPKPSSKIRIRCFRQLSLSTRLVIIGFHTLTLLTSIALMGTMIHTERIQGKLHAELRPSIGVSGNEIHRSINAGLILRFVAILIGVYSVKTQHSPGLVICFTTIVLIVSTIMNVTGISILSEYDSVNWVREFLEKEMVEMDYYEGISPLLVRLQSERKCCGLESYKDWEDFPFGLTSLRVPPSCCLPSRRAVNVTEEDYCGQNLLPDHPQAQDLIYTRGCLAVLTQQIFKFLTASAVLCIIIGVVDAALAIFGIVLVVKEFV